MLACNCKVSLFLSIDALVHANIAPPYLVVANLINAQSTTAGVFTACDSLHRSCDENICNRHSTVNY